MNNDTQYQYTGSEIDLFKKLSDNIHLCVNCRFNQSRRLGLHALLSQWTLAILSISVIALTSLDAVGYLEKTNHPSGIVSVIQIVLSVAILVYSLLLGMGNFRCRALLAHQCGLSLNDLRKSVLFILSKNNSKKSDDLEKEYKFLTHRYHAFLKKYENHSLIDFYCAQLQIGENTHLFTLRFLQYLITIIEIIILYTLQFFHYFLVQLIAISCVYPHFLWSIFFNTNASNFHTFTSLALF